MSPGSCASVAFPAWLLGPRPTIRRRIGTGAAAEPERRRNRSGDGTV